MTFQRMWINQPSTLQPYHSFHGQNVWAVDSGGDEVDVCFTNDEDAGVDRLAVIINDVPNFTFLSL